MAALPNVRHLQLKTEDVVEPLRAALAGRAAAVVACDMNKTVLQCVELLDPVVQFLKPGGLLVLTVKCIGTGRDQSKQLQDVHTRLGASFSSVRTLWLMANTNKERTVVAIK